jgi:predicted Zn-dependent peptidase
MLHSFTLACGMPLIIEQIPGVRSVGLHWLVPAGAATDPAERQGLAPILAEMLMRGAGDLDSRAQADAMDALGLVRDVDVGTSFLRLSATLIGDKIEQALPLLTDMVLRPRLDASALEPSRELCVQSLEGLSDHPEERAALTLRARHLPDPLGRSGLGTAEGLAAVTLADVRDHWRKQARPRGSILAIAGAVDPPAIRALLDRLLAGWTGESPTLTWAGGTPHRGTHHHEQDQSNQVHIYAAHDAPAEAHPDSALERVLLGVLSGGPSARLFTEVRERRGLCYSVSASFAPDKHFGRVVAYVGTTPEKAQQSLEVLCAELKRATALGEAEVTREEFDRAVVGVKSALVFSGESTSARAAALASDQHRLGRPRSLADIARAIDAVTFDGLRAYARRRQPGPLTSVALGPAPLARPAW